MEMPVQTVEVEKSFSTIINYELLKGNELWRFAAILIIIILTLIVARIVQYILVGVAKRRKEKIGENPISLLLHAIGKPAYVVVFALGLYACALMLKFGPDGISESIETAWYQIAKAVATLSVAYALYKLVDVIEYYLLHLTSKTDTQLDDMLVPVVRKSLRITVAIIAVIFIVENVLEKDVTSILLGAGVGGIAIALAAKDTIANFFGSITIFADRPFQINELVKIDGHLGPVEDVGFRSTRIRTLHGHLVTIPNSSIANAMIENLGRRPFIRRISNITITYDSTHRKAEQAVNIIKEILADVPEVNTDSEKPPRVYFNEFNDCSLNIYMSYWVKPPDYWLAQEIAQRVNLEMMKRFEEAKIEFAFPTQTLYLKKDED